jgi:phosphatidylserine decarboxylase
MDFSYLPKTIHFFWVFLAFLLYVGGLSYYFLGLSLFFLILLFLFRKSSVDFYDSSSIPDGFLLSPSNGRVVSIRKKVEHEAFGQELVELRVSISWLSGFGLQFPITGEIENYELRKGKSFLRWSGKNFETEERAHIHAKLLAIKGKNSEEIGMEFLKCDFGLEADLWVRPGDKGKRKARFGYFPFGGTMLVYFSGDFEVLVSPGERLVQGETPLAGKFC